MIRAIIELERLSGLLSAAVIGTDVTDNSVVARLAASGATADWDTFDNQTDSLQAIRNKETDTQDIQGRLPAALGEWQDGQRCRRDYDEGETILRKLSGSDSG